MEKLSLDQFKVGLIMTIAGALLLFLFNWLIGKNELFLLLNEDLGKGADYLFIFFTFLGDGIWWILILILFILFRRNFLPLLLFSFAFSEIFIESFKNFIIPNELRPITAIADTKLIHTVAGVELHTIGSFPSGHTTQAFIFFLLGCLMIKKKWILPVGFLYALLVGYSRIYLAQHFPRDVAGGMLFAGISVLLALLIFHRWFENKKALQ